MAERTSKWKIYYADGSVYSSTDGPWSSAPALGVQVVVLYYEYPLRELVAGVDKYTIPGERKVLRGSLMLPESAFQAIEHRAFSDMDWPS